MANAGKCMTINEAIKVAKRCRACERIIASDKQLCPEHEQAMLQRQHMQQRLDNLNAARRRRNLDPLWLYQIG